MRWLIGGVTVLLSVGCIAQGDPGESGFETQGGIATLGEDESGSEESGSADGWTPTGGGDACAGYPYQATADEIAATPREDADAEIIALVASGEFVAPQDLYDRVVQDLGAIRAEHPDLDDIHAMSPWPGSMPVAFDEEGTALLQAGTYDGWDCPNERYELDASASPVLEDTAFIELGGKRLNVELLAKEYLELPNIHYTEAFGVLDGSYICLQIEGGTHHYLFARGGGDCPSGCTEWDHYEIDVDVGGTVTLVAESSELPGGWTWLCVE